MRCARAHASSFAAQLLWGARCRWTYTFMSTEDWDATPPAPM